MLNMDLVKQILMVAVANTFIVTAFVQKVKECIQLKSSNVCILVSFFSSMIIGTLFSLTFSNLGLVNSLWSGLFSFIGADLLYKTFEEKLFSSYKSIYYQTVSDSQSVG